MLPGRLAPPCIAGSFRTCTLAWSTGSVGHHCSHRPTISLPVSCRAASACSRNMPTACQGRLRVPGSVNLSSKLAGAHRQRVQADRLSGCPHARPPRMHCDLYASLQESTSLSPSCQSLLGTTLFPHPTTHHVHHTLGPRSMIKTTTTTTQSAPGHD
jgi:hypothetical protein